jgi:cell division transport system permease protein
MYAMREAMRAFRRAPLLTGLSAGMIALSLFLVGLFGLAAHNVRRALERVESRVEIVAFLRRDAIPEMVRQAQEQIEQYDEVREVLYISREAALIKARREFPEFEEQFGSLESNPLPASIEVMLRPNQSGPEVVERVATRIREYPFVDDVRYGSEWLDKVFLLRRVAGTAMLVLGISFAIVASLIIATAIRMAIYARRDEIQVMRLVGATEGFVRGPFILEGLLTGLLGGIVAVAATYAVHETISRSVFQLEWLPSTWMAAGIAAGAVVGIIASAIAVRRHLREV